MQLDLFDSTPIPIEDKGKRRAAQVLGHIVRNTPEDAVVSVADIRFEEDLRLTYPTSSSSMPVTNLVHSHALQLASGYLKIPWGYVSGLLNEQSEWAKELCATNLNTLLHHRRRGSRHLIRSVHGLVCGFMSANYKLMNSELIADAFAEACMDVGAELSDGYSNELRIALQATLPRTFTVRGKKYTVGVMLKNSDFRKGPLSVSFLIGRPGKWCINGHEGLRRVHKGRRLDEKNLELLRSQDSSDAAKATAGLVHQHLSPENIKVVMEEVALAESEHVDPSAVSKMLHSLALTDVELQCILERIKDEPTRMDLAAALAWLAETELGIDRKLDFMAFAGGLVMK